MTLQLDAKKLFLCADGLPLLVFVLTVVTAGIAAYGVLVDGQDSDCACVGLAAVFRGDGDGSRAFAYRGDNAVFNCRHRLGIGTPSHSLVGCVTGFYRRGQGFGAANTKGKAALAQLHAGDGDAGSFILYRTGIEYGAVFICDLTGILAILICYKGLARCTVSGSAADVEHLRFHSWLCATTICNI